MSALKTLLIAAPVAAGLLAAPSVAHADWHGRGGWHGGGYGHGWHGGGYRRDNGGAVAGAILGLGAAAIIGGALAAQQPYYAPPPPVYYAPPPPVYYAPAPGYYYQQY
jgi:hypothetical protein